MNQICPSCCAALPSLVRANEHTKYAPPPPHHMPSSLRLRVIWEALNCLRVDRLVASRSGTVTQAILYVVPGVVATDRSGTCVPPSVDAFIASSSPASSASDLRTPLPSGSASCGGVQRYSRPFGLPASSVR